MEYCLDNSNLLSIDQIALKSPIAITPANNTCKIVYTQQGFSIQSPVCDGKYSNKINKYPLKEGMARVFFHSYFKRSKLWFYSTLQLQMVDN